MSKTFDPMFSTDPTIVSSEPKKENVLGRSLKYNLYIFQLTLNLVAHILIGIIVGVCLLFTFWNNFPLPLGPTPIHIILCVIGHQLLMAESFLCLSSFNGWVSKLRHVDKLRAHWVLQIVGSGMALAGSFIKIMDKEVHWNTYHGQFALVAMVFTVASLLNGLTALYAYEFRKLLNGTLSKLTHICFGTIAFAASGISLCFAFDYERFRNWSMSEVADVVIALTAILTFIVIINPFITFYSKATIALRR
ncbi:transmembrane reductase CYB561D2-like [Battus philenor]|uniref:transmembrane reductase CYB561D2-like n=1 Tax=Battus philenor TaxID=42288 RepID=UPI0035CF10E6